MISHSQCATFLFPCWSRTVAHNSSPQQKTMIAIITWSFLAALAHGSLTPQKRAAHTRVPFATSLLSTHVEVWRTTTGIARGLCILRGGGESLQATEYEAKFRMAMLGLAAQQQQQIDEVQSMCVHIAENFNAWCSWTLVCMHACCVHGVHVCNIHASCIQTSTHLDERMNAYECACIDGVLQRTRLMHAHKYLTPSCRAPTGSDQSWGFVY